MGYVRKTEKVGQCDGKMGCCLRSTKLTFARNADKIAAEADGNHSRGGSFLFTSNYFVHFSLAFRKP